MRKGECEIHYYYCYRPMFKLTQYTYNKDVFFLCKRLISTKIAEEGMAVLARKTFHGQTPHLNICWTHEMNSATLPRSFEFIASSRSPFLRRSRVTTTTLYEVVNSGNGYVWYGEEKLNRLFLEIFFFFSWQI